jgi:hypothetical protein
MGFGLTPTRIREIAGVQSAPQGLLELGAPKTPGGRRAETGYRSLPTPGNGHRLNSRDHRFGLRGVTVSESKLRPRGLLANNMGHDAPRRRVVDYADARRYSSTPIPVAASTRPLCSVSGSAAMLAAIGSRARGVAFASPGSDSPDRIFQVVVSTSQVGVQTNLCFEGTANGDPASTGTVQTGVPMGGALVSAPRVRALARFGAGGVADAPRRWRLVAVAVGRGPSIVKGGGA